MNRQEKEAVIEMLQQKFSGSQAAFLVGYRGLTVVQMQTLRAQLREQQGLMKVTKARLMKRAVEGVEGVNLLTPYLKDQIGVVFADGEPPAVAKVLRDFAKQNQALQLIAGCLDAVLLDGDSVRRIASMPSKDVLRAQVCGTLQAPISGFVMVLQQLILRLLWVLREIENKKD